MESIPLKDIYQHKLNFLIGSGASTGLFPTLWLPVKDSDNPTQKETIETLATKLDHLGYKKHHALLFMYYYQNIIKPVCDFKIEDLSIPHPPTKNIENCDCKLCKKKIAIKNYEIFVDSTIRLLQQKNEFSRRCNLFTTNYDGCIPLVADKLIENGNLLFTINDGTSGFFTKTLSAKNFNNYLCERGIFGKHAADIPQINFINLHGSAYWRKVEDSIVVDYNASAETNITISDSAANLIDKLEKILKDETKNTQDILDMEIELDDDEILKFWDEYNKLPIVNPTKWKFHETVFEEHYYQMLRLLSYQLEEQNSVLITFGFSFADEHILNLVKRSLSNPTLQMFVCCFNENEKATMESRFNGFRNVELISLDEILDFTKFNEMVFNAELLRSEVNNK